MGGRARPWLLGLAIGGVLLVFVIARFPFDRLAPAAAAAAAQALGAEVTIAGLGVGLGRGGPEAVLERVLLRWPGDPPLQLDHLGVRPAWSLAWLEGQPRWRLASQGAVGVFQGELGHDRLDAELHEFDIAALPWGRIGGAPPIHGRLSGRLDLELGDSGWVGTAALTGGEGSVDHPALPVAIPYERLDLQVVLDPEAVALPAARLEGPLVTATFAGRAVASAPDPARWPLTLHVEIERVDPALRSYLGPLGIRLDPKGHGTLEVTGTLSAPIVTQPGR